jgi:Type ISP C-terminal specificity domain
MSRSTPCPSQRAPVLPSGVHGLLPDYHAFSGRGGYAFPLRDSRPGHGPFNISPFLLGGPAASYGTTVRAEDAFDAILALLSATSYTLRFAEDLEDVIPHVPFPSDHATFLAAAELGRKIRAVETFARPPGPNFLTRAVARVETEAAETLHASEWTDGELFLCANRARLGNQCSDLELFGQRLSSAATLARGRSCADFRNARRCGQNRRPD